MRSLERLFADYAWYHQTAGNQWCHRAGVPLIVFSLMGILARIVLVSNPVFRLDGALLLIGLVTVFYFMLEWRLGSIMLAISMAMWAVGTVIPLWMHIGLFVTGWALRLFGHGVYENRQPGFTRSLVHLLVGPLWILNEVVRVVDVSMVAAAFQPRNRATQAEP
jgi:uncharacterized membrane protein YGL010W